MEPLLRLERIDTWYGQMHILQGVSLQVGAGELVCLLGGNASGKSTTLKTALGLVRPRNGRVVLDGEDVTARPTSYRIARGMAIVPENRRVFAPMTVRENLEMGAYLSRDRAERAQDLERVHELFPLLAERAGQLAGTLSGGEQQMLAVGRALMSRPRLLLMDEPSMACPRCWSSGPSSRSSGSTPPAWPCCWSSRTRTWRWRWPIAATSCRPAGSSWPTRRARCAPTRT